MTFAFSVNLLLAVLSIVILLGASLLAYSTRKLHKLKSALRELHIANGNHPGNNTNKFWYNSDKLENTWHWLNVAFQMQAGIAFAVTACSSILLALTMIPAWITYLAAFVFRRRWKTLSDQEQKEQAIIDKLKRIPATELIAHFENALAVVPHAPPPKHLWPQNMIIDYERAMNKVIDEDLGWIILGTYWTEEDAKEVIKSHLGI